MPLRFTTDKSVRLLRWLMLAVMLFDLINTILGQPKSYWRHPRTAEEDNRLFYLFLSRGLFIYLLAALVYSSTIFFLVSIFPKRLALTLILAFIFGHYYGACSWLQWHWSLGLTGPVIYGALLSLAIVLIMTSSSEK